MERNDNTNLRELLKARAGLAMDLSNKKISDEEFNKMFKEFSDKIEAQRKFDMTEKEVEFQRKNVEVEKKMDEVIIGNIVEPEEPEDFEEIIEVKREPVMKKEKKMSEPKKIVVPKVKDHKIGLNDIVKFLKQQGKPVDKTKEIKKEIVNDLKILKDRISELQRKIRKM